MPKAGAIKGYDYVFDVATSRASACRRYNRFCMSEGPDSAKFRRLLLGWYGQNKRDLPWRGASDPYLVWVSEVMLQQTRVAAVLEPYARFLKRFPTLASLAKSEESEVLALWSGLGYYRRPRLMRQAAGRIAEEHCGKLPQTAAELKKLPGFGAYTSAAVASIGFGEPIACVDGNVERVILRLRGWAEGEVSTTTIRAEAQRLLTPRHAGDFNQAMMELGATLCLPRSPLCMVCPVRSLCRTRGEHPVRKRKSMRRRQQTFALMRRAAKPKRGASHEEEILLEQRGASESLMPGLWQLPEIDLARAPTGAPLFTLRHSITNTNYEVAIHALDPLRERALPNAGTKRQWFPVAAISTLALTGLARKALCRAGLLP